MVERSFGQTGLDFYEFLKETNRTSITNKAQLSDIYNTEFRRRTPGTKDPCFGSVLYGLKTTGKTTTTRGDIIRFNDTVRVLYQDQWHTPRRRPPQAEQNGTASPGPEQNFSSPDDADTGVRYRRKLASRLMEKLKTHRALFISDKRGVSITADAPQFENGKLSLCVEDTGTYEYTINLSVKNTGTEPVYFTYYTPLHWLKHLTLMDEHKVTKTNPLTLQPGDNYEIKVYFHCSLVGFYPATLAFEFTPDLQPSSDPFHIVRFIGVQCRTSLGRELEPKAPYKPRPLPAWTPEINCTIVDGQRPDGWSKMQLQVEVPLKRYPVPKSMNQLVKQLKQPTYFSDKRNLLESPLSWENYTEKLHLLLYLEELQMVVDIKKYNIEDAVMTQDQYNRKLLVLEVLGVSENRPSVLRGDVLLAYPIKELGKKYRGYVHSVQLDSVKLGFSSELLDRFLPNMKFSIEFTINDLTMRLQHRAADLAVDGGLGKVLFPAAVYPPPQTELPKLKLFDSQLERNQEQYQAVQHIVAGSSKPAPYLVFGPPGTGKTVTLVEAIKQIEKTQASCTILACAPSNSAADLLCKKILEHVDQHKVFRMYAKCMDPNSVPEELKACSNLTGEGYVFPAKEELMKYKVMVTTLLTAGRLVTGGIPAGHYTHMFVDEAGHAVETECIIPLAGLLHPETGQVVLAGDPKQLGPILRSPFALKNGLGVSLLERLMNNFSLYEKDEGVFNNRFVTKLLRNYRSHPAILKFPNERFYEGELQCYANEMLRNSFCSWEHLKRRDFPLIFHGVTGIDEREASSPSFFNIAEVEVLMDYVRKLLQGQGKKGHGTITPKDIGIIAPYRKQVLKIKKALEKIGKEKDFKSKDMKALKVGSVEEFQGQERLVILVSTVRSDPKHAEIDRKFTLGFVKNEKRFNVAMTRAKALLIVVGNPTVLRTDDTWKCFINYCCEEGGYTGFDRAEEDDDVVTRLAGLYLQMMAQVETAESMVQQITDPEWRSDR